MPNLNPTPDELFEDLDPIDLGGVAMVADAGEPMETQGINRAEMSARFTLVTTKPNRQGNAHSLTETPNGLGLRLEEHQRNPVVLFEHGFGGARFPAIGKSQNANGDYTVKVMQSKAVGTVFFSQSNPDAQIVFGMVDEGILHMASIGFDAIKGIRMKQATPPKLAEGVESFEWQQRGILFTETVLKEWSIVAQGADLGAMAQTLAHGKFHGEKITETMRQWMQTIVGSPLRKFAGWEPGPVETEPVGSTFEIAGVTIKGDSDAVNSVVQTLQNAAEAKAEAAAESPTDVDNGGDGDNLANQIALPNLSEQFRNQERNRQNAELIQGISDALTVGFEKIIDEKFSDLVESQKRLESELDRRTGKIN